jgi:hypothetical protein
MSGDQSADGTDHVKDRIQDEMVVEIPDDVDFLDAIGGAVEIVRGSWKLKLTDEIKERDDQEKAFTYLLAAYAANIASDGERPPTVSRQELGDVFGDEIANDVAWHGWVKTYDGYAEIRPDCLRHATDELAARYGDTDE